MAFPDRLSIIQDFNGHFFTLFLLVAIKGWMNTSKPMERQKRRKIKEKKNENLKNYIGKNSRNYKFAGWTLKRGLGGYKCTHRVWWSAAF
jgi:hypothetical protein